MRKDAHARDRSRDEADETLTIFIRAYLSASARPFSRQTVNRLAFVAADNAVIIISAD
jgi:hypothetical protein